MEELKWPEDVFPDIPAPKPGELTVIAAPRVSAATKEPILPWRAV